MAALLHRRREAAFLWRPFVSTPPSSIRSVSFCLLPALANPVNATISPQRKRPMTRHIFPGSSSINNFKIYEELKLSRNDLCSRRLRTRATLPITDDDKTDTLPTKKGPRESNNNSSTACSSNNNSIPTPSPRNKKIAAVIREGIVSLNQSATAIQTNAHTAKTIFSNSAAASADDAGQGGKDPRQLSEEHRIFVTAQECLDDICTRDSQFPLLLAGEPVMLLGVSVKASFSHADIYWSLPYTVLSSPELNQSKRDYLRDRMDEQLQGSAGRTLIRRINAVLSSYFPPKLRFKAAPPLLIQQILRDLEED